MKISEKPANEAQRLEELKRLQIMDSAAEQDFDDIVELASKICNTPMSLIGLIDESRQWYKAKVGLDGTEAERDVTFCSHAMLDDKLMEVPDATKDDRFFDNPYVTNAPQIKFYAGIPLTTADGYTLGTLCVLDTKARKLDETQLMTLEILGKQVMKLIELRSKMLELNEAKQKAEEATRSKSMFLSTMSHEIRTPMNAIIGLTNILIEEEPKLDQVERLKLLKFSGENLLIIINDILDFSKIEANKLTLEDIDLDLHQLVSNVVEMLRHRSIEKNIKLELEYDKQLPKFVKGDAVRLSQIVTNLLGNAIKFTEKGSVTLSVNYKGPNADRDVIEFRINDTGIGIDADNLKKIFESFSQAGSDTTRKFGGTGLGLAISRNLVSLMGSTIEVESTPGIGSTFSFTLSFERGKREQNAAAISVSDENLKNANLKILVVDDNKVNLFVATNYLRKWGIKYETADDGFQAVEKSKDKSFDLILMDIQLPGIDGFEASQQIRALSDDNYFKTVPIIALTADAMEESRDRALKSTMNDLLSKPFKPDELKTVIAKWALHK